MSHPLPPESQADATCGLECRPISPAGLGWFFALLGWTALISFYGLSGGARFEPIDAWVAQTAREMRQANDWIVPRFSDDIRLQKSPGAYWAVMATAMARGEPINEVDARLPNALINLLLVATIFWLTRRIAGDRAAVFAGFAAASSLIVLYWSHRAASDLGVTTFMTLSLASLWIGLECEPRGPKRVLLILLGYFAAGMGMLYKMPMPLVCVGLPAVAYIVLCNRWKLLASGWHLLGLVLFCVPWLPWVIAVVLVEPTAWDKWYMEYFARFTGELPNVEDQATDWQLYLIYIGCTFVFSVPWFLSVPGAIARGFRRQDGVLRRGQWFLLIWFFSLLLFFTVATGKETRYFLPAMPPIFMLLGNELAVFFDPRRKRSRALDIAGLIGVFLAVIPGFIAAGVLLRRVWLKRESAIITWLHNAGVDAASSGLPPWSALQPPLIVMGAIFALGILVAAILFVRRREHASFGALVLTMWIGFAWAWPTVMPLITTDAAFADFAQRLRALPPQAKASLEMIAQQDPRHIWLSDVRFPRVVDQLVLLEEQGGERNLEFEIRRVAETMLEKLQRNQLTLFVASPEHYALFHAWVPCELAKRGEAMPPTWVWTVAQAGQPDHRYLVFGNRPPPTPPHHAAWLVKLIEKARERLIQDGRITPDCPLEPVIAAQRAFLAGADAAHAAPLAPTSQPTDAVSLPDGAATTP